MWPERRDAVQMPVLGDQRVDPQTGDTQVYAGGRWTTVPTYSHTNSHTNSTGTGISVGTYDYSGNSYAHPRVEVDVVDETVEEWEEEREDGTKVIVRKRTKRTKTTTTRESTPNDWGIRWKQNTYASPTDASPHSNRIKDWYEAFSMQVTPEEIKKLLSSSNASISVQ